MRTFMTLTSRGDDKIKIYFREIRCKVVDWIQLGQGRFQRLALVNAAMNFEVSREFACIDSLHIFPSSCSEASSCPLTQELTLWR
jgi:hypothetical protein